MLNRVAAKPFLIYRLDELNRYSFVDVVNIPLYFDCIGSLLMFTVNSSLEFVVADVTWWW